MTEGNLVLSSHGCRSGLQKPFGREPSLNDASAKTSPTGELETSRHLFQPPYYRAQDGSWHRSYFDAVSHCGQALRWNPATVLSLLSFNYACGDLTLLHEIRRRSWLSRVEQDGDCRLERVPSHDTLWLSHREIAEEFGRRLCDEAFRVCQGRKEIYVLLSGGLDSRVVAGVVARLIREGRLNVKPKALTWGLPDCRDVEYGRAAAKILGFEWVHAEIGPADLLRNVDATAGPLACLVPPPHLHRMLWFDRVREDTLVLAGNYGDMVGRGEFSGYRVLELRPLAPINRFGLLCREVLPEAKAGLARELAALRARTPGQPKYILCEHEMHGHYTRGMIAHAMSVINQYCTTYQMFTDPAVYSYMWSIHPSLRFDEVYALLLESLEPKLARLPWARTNRALQGPTNGARSDLRKGFHDYEGWISGPVYEQLKDRVDSDWFAATGIFDPHAIQEVTRLMRRGPESTQLYGFTPYEIWMWLAAFRRFAEMVEATGRKIEAVRAEASAEDALQRQVASDTMSTLGRFMRRSPFLVNTVKRTRLFLLKRRAKKQYPPRRGLPAGAAD